MDKDGRSASCEEPHNLGAQQAHEHGRGRQASHPMQIGRGRYDILAHIREMNSDRLLSLAAGAGRPITLSCAKIRMC